MRIHNGAELVRHLQVRDEGGSYRRGDREDHALTLPDRQALVAEVESRQPVMRELKRPQTMTKYDLDVAGAQEGQGGLNESIAQSIGSDERTAGSPAARER